MDREKHPIRSVIWTVLKWCLWATLAIVVVRAIALVLPGHRLLPRMSGPSGGGFNIAGVRWETAVIGAVFLWIMLGALGKGVKWLKENAFWAVLWILFVVLIGGSIIQSYASKLVGYRDVPRAAQDTTAIASGGEEYSGFITPVNQDFSDNLALRPPDGGNNATGITLNKGDRIIIEMVGGLIECNKGKYQAPHNLDGTPCRESQRGDWGVRYPKDQDSQWGVASHYPLGGGYLINYPGFLLKRPGEKYGTRGFGLTQGTSVTITEDGPFELQGVTNYWGESMVGGKICYRIRIVRAREIHTALFEGRPYQSSFLIFTQHFCILELMLETLIPDFIA